MGTATNNVTIDLDEDRPHAASEGLVIEETSAVALIQGDVIDEDADGSDRLPDQATPNSDGTVTLKLLYPRTLVTKKDGKTRERLYDSLTFHRLNGADQRAIAAAREDMMSVVAIAQSAKISLAVMNVLFDKMDAADIQNAGQVLNHFLSSGRKAGKRS